jgi:hypothetical protein
VDRSTINRWVLKSTPEIDQRIRVLLQFSGKVIRTGWIQIEQRISVFSLWLPITSALSSLDTID